MYGMQDPVLRQKMYIRLDETYYAYVYKKFLKGVGKNGEFFTP